MSEDRNQEGLILLHSVRANTSITIWRHLRSFGQWITRSKEDAAILPSIRQLDVKAHSLSQSVGTLSGGNQQKVSIAKWLAAKAEILIIDEPTVGIDIKTKNALHELVWDLAANGKSILLISSDMPEVIRLLQAGQQVHFNGAGGGLNFEPGGRVTSSAYDIWLVGDDGSASIQKTIMAMTLGKDVSALFPDVLKNIATSDLDQKKLVYLYLMSVSPLAHATLPNCM